jgi:ComF family protein
MGNTRLKLEGLKQVTVLYEYEGRAAQAVKRLKYDRITSLGSAMSDLLVSNLQTLILGEDVMVIPVPIHWTRRFHRGFNQSEHLCRSLPGSVICRGALKRRRATRPQVGLSGAERSQNLKGAFVAGAEVQGRHVLLVDDVLTTGHTAKECARTLLSAGALSVSALFFTGELLRTPASLDGQ